jgi:hypothetical protein
MVTRSLAPPNSTSAQQPRLRTDAGSVGGWSSELEERQKSSGVWSEVMTPRLPSQQPFRLSLTTDGPSPPDNQTFAQYCPPMRVPWMVSLDLQIPLHSFLDALCLSPPTLPRRWQALPMALTAPPRIAHRKPDAASISPTRYLFPRETRRR